MYSHMHTAKSTRKAGFTLIEMLVVVGIILLLIALLMPVVNKAFERGKMAMCISNLHQWAGFWSIYCSDHKGSFSDGVKMENGQVIGWRRGEWASVLEPYYMNNTGILTCPKAVRPLVKNNRLVAYGGPLNTYQHGAADDEVIALRSSYGINCWVYNPPLGVNAIQGRLSRKHWRRMGTVRTPTETPLFLDSMWRGSGPDETIAQKIAPPQYHGEWTSGGNPYNYEIKHVALDRHRGGIMACFMDMSTRHVPIRQLWALKWHKEYDTSYRPSWPTWMLEYPDPDKNVY